MVEVMVFYKKNDQVYILLHIAVIYIFEEGHRLFEASQFQIDLLWFLN